MGRSQPQVGTTWPNSVPGVDQRKMVIENPFVLTEARAVRRKKKADGHVSNFNWMRRDVGKLLWPESAPQIVLPVGVEKRVLVQSKK